MIEAGSAETLGASFDGAGVNFAVFAGHAEAVWLCLYDAAGAERRLELPACTGGVWHGYVPECRPGQRYGFRAAGTYAPERGLRYNAHKLLIDPYARELAGRFAWRPELFGYDVHAIDDTQPASGSDSSAFVPKAVVQGPRDRRPAQRRVPWGETIIYETHVRGFTMRHPAVPDADRGTFRGMRHREVLEYVKALGVTTIELMPVHAYLDEQFLHERGLRNFWGYNTIGFFAPEPRYLGGGPVTDFRAMVDAIHEMNLEVVLDVVYNHTAEGDGLGPTLSFRGLDNLAYYRLHPDDPGEYVNDTGCGNTLNADHPQVQRLILDSLRYWAVEMGVDGFRFDLATVLGRTAHGYDPHHPLLAQIARDPALAGVKLIAEPWDLGPGGYRLGGFPPAWAEWNDRYRDSVRRFWRGDEGEAPEFARRVHGSADLFESSGRGPAASINLVASHDGFTTADVVAYERRHNHANKEQNRDGHRHNFSRNYGLEGPTDDPAVNEVRRRQRLNLLATLLLSQGTPMLLAGDEMGNTQSGNNNAYAQDNPVGWLDWSGLETDPAFHAQIRRLVHLRRKMPLLRQTRHLHGDPVNSGRLDIEWCGARGEPLDESTWASAAALGLLLCDVPHEIGGDAPAVGAPAADAPAADADAAAAIALLFNATGSPVPFVLPDMALNGAWQCLFESAESAGPHPAPREVELPARSCACYAFFRRSRYT